MKPTRLFDLLNHAQENYSFKPDFLAGKENGNWYTYNINQIIDKVNALSSYLLSLNIDKGSRIVSIINNRPEWIIIDMAVLQAGFIHVPVYPTISKEEYSYIFMHSTPSMVFISEKSIYEKIKNTIVNSKIKHVVSLISLPNTLLLKDVIEQGQKLIETNKEKLNAIKHEIKPDDVATIIYTSGTTGHPKGVMLSHNNILSNVKATAVVHDLSSESKALSFLPLSHVYERMLNYHYLYKGISVYYAENLGTIGDNLKEIQPEIFCAVPRIFELFLEKILSRGHDLNPISRIIFFYAIRMGMKYKLEYENHFFKRLQYQILNKLVYSKIYQSLGGKLKIVVSGGASLQPRLARLFWAAGIKLLEGYGLTETSPVIAVNRLSPSPRICFGTVGPVIDGVEVKIAPDGEILCKGPNVMLGYYKDSLLTQEVIDKEGWFHTGDIGTIINDEFLKITDRKKEIFKLSSGKYIAPQVIENLLKESEFIEQAIVIGENEKFASALIQPNFYYLHSWCAFRKIHFQDNADLILHAQVQELFQKIMNEINKQLGQTEQIKRFRLVSSQWSYETGELSPTLKLKRKFIMQKYNYLIKEIYQK